MRRILVGTAMIVTSTERLMNLPTALDQYVEIVIRKKPRSRKLARISVAAARAMASGLFQHSGRETYSVVRNLVSLTVLVSLARLL